VRPNVDDVNDLLRKAKQPLDLRCQFLTKQLAPGVPLKSYDIVAGSKVNLLARLRGAGQGKKKTTETFIKTTVKKDVKQFIERMAEMGMPAEDIQKLVETEFGAKLFLSPMHKQAQAHKTPVKDRLAARLQERQAAASSATGSSSSAAAAISEPPPAMKLFTNFDEFKDALAQAFAKEGDLAAKMDAEFTDALQQMDEPTVLKKVTTAAANTKEGKATTKEGSAV
jgi:hypothetical protein